MAECPKAVASQISSLWPVSRETQQRLETYVGLLEQWQRRINLVAPSTMDDVWSRHILDSVQTLAAASAAKTWIDIGSGAGFPGLVTAILLSEAGEGTVHLIESVGKKCAFMSAVVREVGLRGGSVDVQVHGDRIENVLRSAQKPDAVSARALGPLVDLLHLTDGLLVDGCVGVFAKGRGHEAEIALASEVFDFNIELKNSVLGDGSVLLTVSNVRRIG
ncbi:16S rRNA (guanine(527)-N(7))-methyltransferase RsmG [Pseudahrensia aquimaris]|uniref:Ribosomal RNA small subunit methyltransferase G n=1 Tax=Pseudahrensia aquimaris TaxID=744461 RepID=A0ABW3FFN6_9HYPH